MQKRIIFALVLVVTLFLGIIAIYRMVDSPERQQTTPTQDGTTNPLVTNPNQHIVVDDVLGGIITSPLRISGKARLWYFEGSFPVRLLDANGALITVQPAQAQGDWMTTEFVPFVVSLTWEARPNTATGTLIFQKDNPSGDPSRDELYAVPVRFY